MIKYYRGYGELCGTTWYVEEVDSIGQALRYMAFNLLWVKK